MAPQFLIEQRGLMLVEYLQSSSTNQTEARFIQHFLNAQVSPHMTIIKKKM